MSSITVNTAKTRRPRRRQQRRGAQKRNVTVKVKAVRAVQNPRRRVRRARNRGGGLKAVLNSRTPSGLGATSFSDTKMRTITVTNDEFIGAVTVANQPNFNVVSYPINPGQATTFPWLSLQAKQWEKYVFHMLEFYYKREVSEFNAAGAAGKVIYSVDFDAADAAPSTKQQMEDTVPHVDAMPSENMKLVLPKKQMHGPSVISKYVRIGGLPGSADIKTYDIGRLHVATQGVPANSEIGELRVRYTCQFSVPVLESTNVAPANNQAALFNQVGVASGATGVDYTPAFATTITNGLSITNVAGVFTPPAGNYLVDVGLTSLNSTQNLTSVQVELMKNGVATAYPSRFGPIGSANPVTNASVDIPPAWVTVNGTDTIQVRANVTYTAGVNTTSAQIRFIAV